MRIAIVVRQLKMGGMERVAVSLANAFADNGHESHLIFFKDRKNVLFPNENVHLHHFNLNRMMQFTVVGIIWELFAKILNALIRKSYFIWKGLFTAPLFKYKLKKLEQEYGDFDLIIFRGIGTFEMTWPLRDTRFVQVSESVLHEDNLNLLRQFYAKHLFSKKNVVCVSNGVQESFLALQKKVGFAAKKVITITNPLDIEAIREQSCAYLPEISSPYIVSVGRLVPAKNIALLINAYSFAKQHFHLQAKLVIVGDGPERKNLELQVQNLHLEGSVIFTGQQTNPFPWMKHAKLFVLSSKHEGLGMVLLEAMACGTNVVATNSPGGVKDVMTGELATHLSEQNAPSLAKKIMQALSEEETDYEKYLENNLPETITNKFIQNFITPVQFTSLHMK